MDPKTIIILPRVLQPILFFLFYTYAYYLVMNPSTAIQLEALWNTLVYKKKMKEKKERMKDGMNGI